MRHAAVLVLFSHLLAAGCAGELGCRSQSQCSSMESCVPPGVRRACGIPCNQERQCESATDCPAGQVCAEHVDVCCFAGELSSRCATACTAGSCAEGERCDEASGLCEVVTCHDGFVCPTQTSCAPGAADADRHGCVRDACSGDGGCADGACVGGRCYDGPGTCEGPVP